MPDGRRLTFTQLAQELGGKSPTEAFKTCGYDFSQVMEIVNS